MNDLENISLLQLLPSNLAKIDAVRQAATALDVELKKVTQNIRRCLLYPRLDELSEAEIDLLAWQFHVDFYEPIGMDVDTKRKLVRESIAWHRLKGTPAGVEKVLSAEFDSSEVEEWFNYQEGEGLPYHFRVVTSDAMHGSDSYREIIRAIETVKNVRSVLDGIIFRFQLEDDNAPPIDDVPAYSLCFDMEDNFPLAKRLYGSGIYYGGGYYYGGAVDRMEMSVALDIREDKYTVSQKAYGEGRIYGDGGEPYGGTLGPADRGGAFSASISINYGEGMTYGASTQFYGTGHVYDGSIKYGNKARVYGGWRLEEDIS